MRLVSLTRLSLAAAVGLVALGGCSQLGGGESSCSGADASNVTLEIVRSEIIDRASQVDEGDPKLSRSKVRATVRDLVLSLIDVRTSKDDPNSSKQFCTGRIKLVAPAQLVMDADAARKIADLNSVEDMADNANVEQQANMFFAEIDFNIQPTDDGSKIFANIESGDEALNFFAELVKDHLLKSAVAGAKAETDRVTAEQEAAEINAEREVLAASLDEAKSNNAAAVSAINAIWKAIPQATRSSVLASQKAWGRKKDAVCQLEGASTGGDPATMAVARLNCDTREQLSRAEALRAYAEQEINNSETNAM